MFNVESTQNFTGGRNQFQIRSLKHLLPVSGWIRLTGKGQGHITSETNEMKMSSEDPRLMETLRTVALCRQASTEKITLDVSVIREQFGQAIHPCLLLFHGPSGIRLF